VTGLVVVSHSHALAQGAVALAQEMVQGQDVRIVVAAGLDEQTLGTDAVRIADAIAEADRGDGVVVFMDLGSAVLSAELALDLLDDGTLRDRVVLCPAPLVEGLIVAAVSAGSGAGPQQVAAEALDALAGKQVHLAGRPDTAPAATAGEPPAAVDEVTATFTVPNPHGLHARPASRLVQRTSGMDAQVLLRNATSGTDWVPASSLSRVATLGALQGHELQVRACGPDARAAVDAVLALAADAFGEAPPGAAASAVALAGPAVALAAPAEALAAPASGPLGASGGIGIGPAWSLHDGVDLAAVPDARTDDPAADRLRLTGAVEAARTQLQRLRDRTAAEIGAEEAAIFDAHLLLLTDPNLLDDVARRIDSGQAAAPAWAAAVERVAGELAALRDEYLQARAADIRAVGRQVLRPLTGTDRMVHAGHGVLLAPDLTPAEAAELDSDRVVAIVLAGSSPTAHSAILARARGIPAVVAAGPGVLGTPDGTEIAVDGTTGEVVVAPSAAVLADFRARAEALRERHLRALATSTAPAVTRDGIEVLVGANVGSVDDAKQAAAAGADLAGLVRTEFLFLGRDEAPGVDEQEAVYRAISEALGGRRITLRTLDVGGDKPLGYVPMPAEANPFLGVRGIRLALARPALLADQLLAVVRVAHDVPVSLMLPMVSTLDELVAARGMLDDAIRRDGRGEPAGLQFGMMVEVPAAALKARAFADHVDFFSIGTNDLTQYALAAERGNDAVATLGDPFDPGVLALVDAVCRGADGRALVAVCGELAADEQAAAVLAGLGVRELSVAPRLVPAVKEAVRAVDLGLAAGVARTALTAGTAAEVRTLLTRS
jgi:phosphocarrier protein FPr